MLNIVAIGASGFIGSRLSKRLLKKTDYNLLIVDKVLSPIYPDLTKTADVRDIESLRQTIEQDSIIINLAAEHRDDVRPRSLYDDVNVGGARNLCQVAREKNIKTIIFTSSVAVYGFAPIGTDESGKINPFNDYGRTKYEAEQIFSEWQAEDASERALIIIRPTVVFGEQNRGNVYNLLRQVASGRFMMIGDGTNQKSMAYVENVTAFIEYAISFKPGKYIYNYVDKPDFSMNDLVGKVNYILGRSEKIKFRLPFWFGYTVGLLFDVISKLTGKRFAVSSIRIKKFTANTVFGTGIDKLDFIAPVSISDALEKTVRHEFVEKHSDKNVFYTE